MADLPAEPVDFFAALSINVKNQKNYVRGYVRGHGNIIAEQLMGLTGASKAEERTRQMDYVLTFTRERKVGAAITTSSTTRNGSS